jgi:hypothetical protein
MRTLHLEHTIGIVGAQRPILKALARARYKTKEPAGAPDHSVFRLAVSWMLRALSFQVNAVE